MSFTPPSTPTKHGPHGSHGSHEEDGWTVKEQLDDVMVRYSVPPYSVGIVPRTSLPARWQNCSDKETVVIKKLLRPMARVEIARMNACQEAPTYYGCFHSPNGDTYIFMEYVHGPTLFKFLKNGNPFPHAGVNAAVQRLLDASAWHLDLHFGNFIVTGQHPMVRVIDFGPIKYFPRGYNFFIQNADMYERARQSMTKQVADRLRTFMETQKNETAQKNSSKNSKRSCSEISSSSNDHPEETSAVPCDAERTIKLYRSCTFRDMLSRVLHQNLAEHEFVTVEKVVTWLESIFDDEYILTHTKHRIQSTRAYLDYLTKLEFLTKRRDHAQKRIVYRTKDIASLHKHLHEKYPCFKF